MVIFQKVFSNRVKGIHIINWAPYVDILLNIVKVVFKPKIFGRVSLAIK